MKTKAKTAEELEKELYGKEKAEPKEKKADK